MKIPFLERNGWLRKCGDDWFIGSDENREKKLTPHVMQNYFDNGTLAEIFLILEEHGVPRERYMS